MTDLMKEIQTEIQRIQDDFNRTLFHIVKNNTFIYEDLESSRRPETLLPVNQTIQYLDELKSVAHDFQARTAQSSERIYELTEKSADQLRFLANIAKEELHLIQAYLSEPTDENVLNARGRVSALVHDLTLRFY